MTDTPSTSDGPEPAHSAFRVLTAIADLGEATAAAIAQHAELGYSTVTPKLRAWETSGHAEKYRHAATSQTLWRLTAAGRATTGVTDDEIALHAADGSMAPAVPADSPPADIDAAPSHSGADRHDDVEGADGDDAEDVGPEVGEPDADIAAAEPAPTPSDADADPLPADATAAADDADATPHDDANTSAAPEPAAVAKRKRPAGALEASVLDILRNRPDETFKVNDLRKLVDKADEGTGYSAASAGAVSNALTKLTGTGDVDTVEAKHATYQAAPASD
jgi:hypothetical protein